jgi:hypothetical protein
MFPTADKLQRLAIVIVAGHGDVVNQVMQYELINEPVAHRCIFKNIALNLLPLVQNGVVLSTCGSMAVKESYSNIYSGQAWLAGYCNLDKKGEQGVPWTYSVCEEVAFLTEAGQLKTEAARRAFIKKYSKRTRSLSLLTFQ